VVVAEFERVKGIETYLFTRGDLIGVSGVPLRDAGVEVPAVEVDALVGFAQLGEQFACTYKGFAFEIHEAYDYISDLNPGVVDVVLDAHLIAALEAVRAKKALEGVAEDGI